MSLLPPAHVADEALELALEVLAILVGEG